MPVTATEVEIKFRPTPYNIFELGNAVGGVRLPFRVWPEAQIGLSSIGKKTRRRLDSQIDDLSLVLQPGSDMRP
jgi:glucose-6-phosphate 1-dehydrogenase